MGLRFNAFGFVIRQPDGVVTFDSKVSAATGKRTGQAGVLKAVPGSDGLYLRLHRKDELRGQQAKELYQQARAWLDEQQPAAEPDDEQPPDPDDAPPGGGDGEEE